jgi:general stress protein YciG
MIPLISEEELAMTTKARRGFASMDPSKQRAIASKGGKAAHRKGTAHEFTPEEAAVAGRKGGENSSRNRAMAAAARTARLPETTARPEMHEEGHERSREEVPALASTLGHESEPELVY